MIPGIIMASMALLGMGYGAGYLLGVRRGVHDSVLWYAGHDGWFSAELPEVMRQYIEGIAAQQSAAPATVKAETLAEIEKANGKGTA